MLDKTFKDSILKYLLDFNGGNRTLSEQTITNETDGDKQEILAGLLYLFEDLELKQSETEALEKKLEKKSDQLEKHLFSQNVLLTSASHYLRTPINIVQGFSEMLLNTKLDENQKNIAAKIQLGSKDLTHQVEKMLNLGATQANQLKLNPTGFNLDNFLTPIFEEYRSQLEKRNITLITSLDLVDGREFIGDAKILQEICSSLIESCGRHNQKENTLNILVTTNYDKKLSDKSKKNRSINFNIIGEDRGHKIPEAMIQKIFISTEQEKQKLDIAGSGFGLYLIKSLAQIMNGTFEYEFIEPDLNRFTVSVPLKENNK